ATAYVIWSSAAETGRRHWRWIRRSFGRDTEPQEASKPFVTIRPAGANLNFDPPLEVVSATRKLVAVAVSFDVINEDVHPIRDLTAGVRTRTGRDATFGFHSSVVGPQKGASVRWAAVPAELVREVPHESEWQDFFLLWAEFTDHFDRTWKVVHDQT